MFNAGDTVILKSGGPIMTVAALSKKDDNLVYCAWFNDNELKRIAIEKDAIKTVPNVR